jgi:hypothetical protein
MEEQLAEMPAALQNERAALQDERGAEKNLRVPTLGDVAMEARFASLQELLGPVMDTPVTDLDESSKAALHEAGKEHKLLLTFFFAACAKAASLKRPNVGLDESAQGELQRFPLFSSLTHSCLFGSAP